MADAVIAPEVRSLARQVLSDADALGRRMAELIFAAVPDYDEGQYVEIDEVVRSCTENVRYVLGILAGDQVDRDGPRATGSARAAQRVPYAAVAQAYRIGARFIWESLVERADAAERDLLLRAAADIWVVTDDLVTTATESYRNALEDGARIDGQRRAVVVGAILDGDADDAERLWDASSVLDLGDATDFVVVVAESPSPGLEGLPDVERVLRERGVGSAWRLLHEHQDGVVALPFGFGVYDLAVVLEELAVGRVGVSRPFDSLDRAFDGRRQARAAWSAASPGSREVVRFSEQPLGVLLANSRAQARTMAETVLGGVIDLPGDSRAALLETVRVWLTTGGSTPATARVLHLHRNTVRYRIRRFEDLAGRNLTQPAEAVEVYVALECVRILGLE